MALAVLLQLLLVAAPSSALVLCVSDDGCTSVEIALPGSTDCLEADCGDEHRAGAGDEHACRDFSVVAAAPAKAHPVTLEQPLLAAGWAAPPLLTAPPLDDVVEARAVSSASAVRRLRSTVLQL